MRKTTPDCGCDEAIRFISVAPVPHFHRGWRRLGRVAGCPCWGHARAARSSECGGRLDIFPRLHHDYDLLRNAYERQSVRQTSAICGRHLWAILRDGGGKSYSRTLYRLRRL